MTYQSSKMVDVTLSVPDGAQTANKVLAATQQVANAVFDKNRAAMLDQVVVIDEDDAGAALDLYFFSANSAIGTEGQDPGLTDAAARELLGVVSIATTDYKDFGGAKVATLRNIGLILKPATDTSDVYIAAVNGAGTPTYTVSGLKLRLGIKV